jgi:hypothetical protein
MATERAGQKRAGAQKAPARLTIDETQLWARPYQSKPLLLELDPQSIEPQVEVVVSANEGVIDPQSARHCTLLDPQPHPSNGDGSRVFDEALSSKE